ncbi:ABC transporter permease [Gordonia sp. w5E2]|uniref:ABC transporter n=1 Tax=Gordonia jacobaea TaxID=122202 RepID=A0ABR5ID34_9ACTN|nr:MULTISPECIES: ABC transporter permease [Gordonia]KNA91521.1 ABC transporter [Gordonia jacobaea]SKX85767.1 multidrug ABC transporter inner membrane protein [Mycobacteroides abscessus subsp. abscessus]
MTQAAPKKLTALVAAPESGTEPHARALTQLWVLVGRGVGGIVRNGEFIFAFVAPVLLAVCFYLPLRSIMDSDPGMDYAQFLMPIIALQSVGFVASAAAMRAANDATKGVHTRFRTLPMRSWVPVSARLGTNGLLLTLSITCATATSLVMGWRPHGSVAETIGLFAVAFVVGLLIAAVADAIGLLSDSPEATSQALSLPILILGMMSTGFVPESQFPEWIAPFVRNQPISQFATSMRALGDGSATREILMPTVWWCIGLAAAAVVLGVFGARKAAR